MYSLFPLPIVPCKLSIFFFRLFLFSPGYPARASRSQRECLGRREKVQCEQNWTLLRSAQCILGGDEGGRSQFDWYCVKLPKAFVRPWRKKGITFRNIGNYIPHCKMGVASSRCWTPLWVKTAGVLQDELQPLTTHFIKLSTNPFIDNTFRTEWQVPHEEFLIIFSFLCNLCISTRYDSLFTCLPYEIHFINHTLFV